MKILRDEKTIALGDVIVACHQAAEVCKSAADAAEHEAVAGALRELARDREQVVEELHREAAFRLGETPSDSVPEERMLFEKAATRLTGMVAEVADPALLDRCRDKEKAVIAAVEAALLHFPDGAIRGRLVALSEDSAIRMDRIAELKRSASQAGKDKEG